MGLEDVGVFIFLGVAAGTSVSLELGFYSTDPWLSVQEGGQRSLRQEGTAQGRGPLLPSMPYLQAQSSSWTRLLQEGVPGEIVPSGQPRESEVKSRQVWGVWGAQPRT